MFTEYVKSLHKQFVKSQHNKTSVGAAMLIERLYLKQDKMRKREKYQGYYRENAPFVSHECSSKLIILHKKQLLSAF